MEGPLRYSATDLDAAAAVGVKGKRQSERLLLFLRDSEKAQRGRGG